MMTLKQIQRESGQGLGRVTELPSHQQAGLNILQIVRREGSANTLVSGSAAGAARVEKFFPPVHTLPVGCLG